MEFFITLGGIALVAALPSGLIAMLIWRMKKPYSKPLALASAIVLFIACCWAAFVSIIVISGRMGHPF